MNLPEAPDQWSAATRVILGLLHLQTTQPGSIDIEELPALIQMAADEREKHGDFGAARLLEAWAEKLERPAAEWDD
ncbi:hypothetical protein [Paracoccus sp. (in: a-proteobacteria)]|uniref:hypothetical protein n=1 Tax=Paracoccus sp. TaxID=267 RepID=UPI00289ADEA2|nr:hypothetical protein [Paracoccus sp. (in: a-proteobacteria)]